MREKTFVSIFIAMILCLAFLPWTYGQDPPASTSLVGLRGLFVEAFVIAPPDNAGISEKEIKGDVERQLSGAGIEILSKEEFDRLGRSLRYPLARFEVSVHISKTGSPEPQVAIVSAVLRQMSQLSRKPVIKYWAPTWESRHILIHSNPENLREYVMKVLEEFISDFRSVNP